MQGISLDRRSLPQKLADYLRQFMPSPKPKSLWLDAVWVLAFAFIQEIIWPTFFPSWIRIDIVTPWLVFNAIARPGRSQWVIYLSSCLVMEGLSSIPAGFYFSAYSLPFFVIPIIRDKLTWSLEVPWVTTFFCSLLWIHGFKLFLFSVLSAHWLIPFEYVSSAISAVALSTSLGLIISKPYQSSEYFVREGIY
ncbi:hypothetical protein N9D31_00850 [Oligoflexaceae bacterium]|nr:hypothetical protein [Oligoflexaceae bacterium]